MPKARFTPEERKRRRAERIRDLMKSPDFQSKRLVGISRVNADEGFQKRRREAIRKYWMKPETLFFQGERMRLRWRDEEFRKKQIEKIKRKMRTKRHSKEYRERNLRALREISKRPDVLERRRRAMIKRNRDPKFNPLAVLSEKQKEYYRLLRRKGCPRDEAIRKASKR